MASHATRNCFCKSAAHAPRCATRLQSSASAAALCSQRHMRTWLHGARPGTCRQLAALRHSISSIRRAAPLPPCSYGRDSSPSDAGGVTAEATSSALIQKEVVLFLIQLDHDKQLQRALNYDNFEAASQIRKQREQLDEAINDFQASKGRGDGGRDACQTEAAGFASEGLRLRSEMQRAAEEERYADASTLRDRLNALQKEATAAAASAAEQGGSGERQYRLGQRVLHARHGYRGVVCGWDVRCCEGGEWQDENGVERLAAGPAQPFYHVLVDLRDWEGGNPQTAIAYVPEELLSPPESAETWGEQHGDDAQFIHPYAGMLFLGNDHAGDFLPSKPLRQKYSAARRDVGPPGEDDDESSGGDGEQHPKGPPDSGSGGGGGPGGLDFGGPDGMTIL